ncbi:MAG: bifunctional riboflavin kinase/FAD synthetase [bacterium]|nr:bifunctional riboflavin kinase/FAD synthetase [bacterium]
MKTIHTFNLSEKILNAYITIGTFDGIHLGHQKRIQTVINNAKANGGTSVVITFDPHPKFIFAPGASHNLLCSKDHKERIIRSFNPDYYVVIPFDRKFSQVTSEQFIIELTKNFEIKELCISHDFRFGFKRQGTANELVNAGKTAGFKTIVHDSLMVDTIPLSSSNILKFISDGDFETAEKLLGRRFSLLGTVIKGHNMGRKIGYPTANIDPKEEIIPPGGVYICEIIIDEICYQGLANIGNRPTFNKERSIKQSVETYIFDFDQDIYDKQIEIIFIKKLREDKQFPDAQSLVNQIHADEIEARKFFTGIYTSQQK